MSHTDIPTGTRVTNRHRTGRRLAAAALIAVAGSAAVSSLAAAESPHDDDTFHAETDDHFVAEPGKPNVAIPTYPGHDGPYTIETIPGTEIPVFPGDGPGDDEPGDGEPGDDEPGDEPESTQPEQPEEPEYPEVEDRTEERAGGEELAHTGSDSKLPLLGAGLVAAGGLAAGASILSRRTRGAES